MITRDANAEARQLSDQGFALLELQRYAEAEEQLVRAASLAPDDPKVHYRLGLLFSDINRLTHALSAYDSAIRLDPEYVQAHNNRGSVLQRLGRDAEAEIDFRRAMALAPHLAPPYINLGHLFESRSDAHAAVDIYTLAIDRGLDSDLFQQHIAVACGVKGVPRSPDAWVRYTFDNFAPSFDAHLEALKYHVPQVLARLVIQHSHNATRILDLGCGTGQCGAMLHDTARTIVGVDLSSRMLALARARNVYEALHECELHEWLQAAPSAEFDVVVAADVLIYIGALEQLFMQVRRVLKPSGLFAFSIEECEGNSYQLLPTGRYAQASNYIEDLAQQQFAIIHSEAATIRMEGRHPIRGRLFVLRAS